MAFALGFYILLRKDGSEKLEEGEEEAGTQKFFNDPGLTMVKTFTMFVGELEFGDLPFDTGAGANHCSMVEQGRLESRFLLPGYLFLLAFVFLIVVVMMNLLNGLAVSDTGAIRQEAEINFYSSQVEVISYVESMLLGDPFDFLSNWPAFVWLRRLPPCSLGGIIFRVPPIRYIFHKVGGDKFLKCVSACLVLTLLHSSFS